MLKNFLAAMMVTGLIVGASFGITSPARADVAADVSAALTANPDGGDALAGAIADIMANSKDPVATAQEILAALGDATVDQKKAVGKGLGTAAALIGLSHPDKASQISALVADASVDPDLQTAYNSAVSPVTGSIGGPGGPAPRSIIGTTGGSYSAGGSASPN